MMELHDEHVSAYILDACIRYVHEQGVIYPRGRTYDPKSIPVFDIYESPEERFERSGMQQRFDERMMKLLNEHAGFTP